MVGQEQDVVGPITQRRNEDGDHVQPEVQILPEAAEADLGRQLLVRSGQHPDIDTHARGPADRLHHLLLQGAQDLRLGLQAHVADLVQEERSAVCQLELAATVGRGPGERSPHMAEQLAFDELLRNCGAVHLHERTRAPPAERVHASRNELFSGAVLPVDQHPPVGRRRHRHLLAQLPHHIAVPHHREPAVHMRAEDAVLCLEPALPERVAHDQHRLLERQRLFDEVERPHFDGPHRRLDVAVAGDHDDRDVHVPLTQPFQGDEAVDSGEPDIEHDDVVRGARRPLETGLAALHRIHLVAFVPQDTAQRTPHAGFVVHDENGGFHRELTSQLPVASCDQLPVASCGQLPVTSLLWLLRASAQARFRVVSSCAFRSASCSSHSHSRDGASSREPGTAHRESPGNLATRESPRDRQLATADWRLATGCRQRQLETGNRTLRQSGTSMTNRVPCGALSCTSMLPPCSTTILRTMARPRPLPRRFVE